MTEVTISPKYQVVIPKEIRESMGLSSGQKVKVLTFRNRIELNPLKPISSLRGILKGIDTNVERADDRL
jgi:AbrB family looped-hinge helix DNA binding protein